MGTGSREVDFMYLMWKFFPVAIPGPLHDILEPLRAFLQPHDFLEPLHAKEPWHDFPEPWHAFPETFTCFVESERACQGGSPTPRFGLETRRVDRRADLN